MKPELIAISILSIGWWVIARLWPSPANTDPMLVQNILAVMGLLFLICGAVVYIIKKNHSAILFYAYCCLAAVHWAGPMAFTIEPADTILLGVFLVIGSVLMESIFLQLALEFGGSRLTFRLLLAVYFPVVVGMFILILVALSITSIDLLLPVYTLGMVYGVGAGFVWIFRLLGNRIKGISLARRMLVSLGLILAWLPGVLVDSVITPEPAYAGLANLSLLFLLWGISSLILSDAA